MKTAIRFIFLLGLVFLINGCATTGGDSLGSKKKRSFAQKYVAMEEFLKKKFADEKLWVIDWKDRELLDFAQRVKLVRAKAKELLPYLHTARVMRAKSLAAVLVGHISHNPFPYREDSRIRTTEMVYPVYAVLKSIGFPAVPYLLAELKRTDPKDQALLVYCLEAIYNQAGHGTELTEQRLRLELAKSEGEAKTRLKAALKLLRRWKE